MLFITIAVATLMVAMEFIYPLLDPRIRKNRRRRSMATIALASEISDRSSAAKQVTLFFRYLRRNKSLAIGLAVLLALVLFTLIGLLVVESARTPIRWRR